MSGAGAARCRPFRLPTRLCNPACEQHAASGAERNVAPPRAAERRLMVPGPIPASSPPPPGRAATPSTTVRDPTTNASRLLRAHGHAPARRRGGGSATRPRGCRRVFAHPEARTSVIPQAPPPARRRQTHRRWSKRTVRDVQERCIHGVEGNTSAHPNATQWSLASRISSCAAPLGPPRRSIVLLAVKGNDQDGSVGVDGDRG
jgi:hypothetical protein